MDCSNNKDKCISKVFSEAYCTDALDEEALLDFVLLIEKQDEEFRYQRDVMIDYFLSKECQDYR